VNYKRAYVVMLALCIYYSRPVLFSSQGKPARCEVFNEAEPMYPDASIKTSFPKNHDSARLK
jgi:hypothetical protein